MISDISSLRPVEFFNRDATRRVEPVVERPIVEDRRADSYHIADLLRVNSQIKNLLDVYA